MNKLFQNWDIARIIRLVIGLIIAIYAIVESDYMFLWLAGLFIFQALLNVSCCGAGGCSSQTKGETKRIYENQIKEYKK